MMMTGALSRFTLQATTVTIGIVLALAAPAPADAQSKKAGWITATSQFGHGTISGPVRPAPLGPQVQMPGGTWIDCAGDCRQALADATIDFWDRQAERDSFRIRN
jgi:hypothetical protein